MFESQPYHLLLTLRPWQVLVAFLQNEDKNIYSFEVSIIKQIF